MCEEITDQAARGDGGNAWGPHKCRIVRTTDGVFTAYTAPGGGHLKREWRLMWRDEAKGKWTQQAAGEAGREPPNLLASPDGTLHILGWPEGQATHWWGRPDGGRIELQSEPVHGLHGGHWPYSGAGIDLNGNLCVVSSGVPVRWVCRPVGATSWLVRETAEEQRHCYVFMLPYADGRLDMAATVDVTWGALGLQQPPDAFTFVFYAADFWQMNAEGKVAQTWRSVAEPQAPECMEVERHLYDVYRDTDGRTHLLYWAKGKSTGGAMQARHAVLDAAGKPLAEQALPKEAGFHVRIFQDDRGHYYLIGPGGIPYQGGTSLLVYQGGADGLGLDGFRRVTRIDLGGMAVDREGFFLAVPRTGTPAGRTLDMVFPTGGIPITEPPGEFSREIGQLIRDNKWDQVNDKPLYAPKLAYLRLRLY
jgi:hypothetical protein